MSLKINTTSTLFKLYVARRRRLGNSWLTTQDIIEHDEPTLNLCTFMRGVILEVVNVGILHSLIVLGGVMGGLLIMVPIGEIILGYLFGFSNQNIFLGGVGVCIIITDAILILVVSVGLLLYWLNTLISKIHINDESNIPAIRLTTKWLKDKHHKICTRCTFYTPDE